MIKIYKLNNQLAGWIDLSKSQFDTLGPNIQQDGSFELDITLGDDQTLDNIDVVNETADVITLPTYTGPTTEQQLAEFTTATNDRLDSFARRRGYQSMVDATSYAGSSITNLSDDAAIALSARDTTIAAKTQIFADIRSGEQTMPTIGEYLTSLPTITWPLTYQDFTLNYDTAPETLSYNGITLPKTIIQGTQDVEFDLSSLITYNGRATDIVSINGDTSGFIQVNPQVTLTYKLGTPILRVNDVQSSGPLTFTAVRIAVSCN